MFLLMCVFQSMYLCAQVDYSGTWEWRNNNDSSSFEIELIQDGGIVAGTHCGVFNNGDKLDCELFDKSIVGKLSGDSVIITFISAFCMKKGTAVLKKPVSGSSEIVWKIIKEPEGEYYLPLEAILEKQK